MVGVNVRWIDKVAQLGSIVVWGAVGWGYCRFVQPTVPAVLGILVGAFAGLMISGLFLAIYRPQSRRVRPRR